MGDPLRFGQAMLSPLEPPITSAGKQPEFLPPEQRPDALTCALNEILEKLPGRVELPPAFNAQAVNKSLRQRFAAGKLGLTALDANERLCLTGLEPDHWRSLALACEFTHLECESDLLPAILPGLEQIPNLQCLSVFGPRDSDLMNFGTLTCKIEILGSLTTVLYDVLKRLATHSTLAPRLDIDAVAKSLRDRFTGLELDLSSRKLDAQERTALAAFTPADWLALHEAAAAKGGAGVAYIECDADLLPKILPGLEGLPNLACVSVWAPLDGGPMDFGALKCRINVLGVPGAALQITACKNHDIDAKQSSSPAIQASQLRTKKHNEAPGPWGPLLTAAPPAPPRVREMPCVGDTALLATLFDQLRNVVAPQLLAQGTDSNTVARQANAVAKALVLCGRYDSEGSFGFDLTALKADHVRWVENLPPLAWNAIRQSAEKSGECIEWIDPHRTFEVRKLANSIDPALCANDAHLVESLTNQLVRVVESKPDFKDLQKNADSVARSAAKALASCGRIDENGLFGFDFKSLTPVQIRLLNALPPASWTLFKQSARKIGIHISWLDLHDLSVSDGPVAGMKILQSTISRLFVSFPAKGNRLRLAQLQPDFAKLDHIVIRARRDERLTITVPYRGPDKHADQIGLRLTGNVVSEANLKASTVIYIDERGNEVLKKPLLEVLADRDVSAAALAIA